MEGHETATGAAKIGHKYAPVHDLGSEAATRFECDISCG
jgi:hypothetical protein